MTVLFLLILCAGLGCFVLAALTVRVGTRPLDLIALGLAFWITVDVIQKVRQL